MVGPLDPVHDRDAELLAGRPGALVQDVFLQQTEEAFHAERDNRILLLTQLLVQPWLTPIALVFIVGALREAFEAEWQSVFRGALSRVLKDLAGRTDYGVAAHHLLALTSNLPEAEHGVVLEVVLAT